MSNPADKAEVEPWMIGVAADLVRVVKAADHFGVVTFEGNGRKVRVVRAPDGISIEFDYAGELTARV